MMTYATSAGYVSNTLDTSSYSSSESWYMAIAESWGTALNTESQTLTALSNEINVGGSDQPSAETELSAESEQMSFLSNAEANSVTSIGSALQTIARKQ